MNRGSQRRTAQTSERSRPSHKEEPTTPATPPRSVADGAPFVTLNDQAYGYTPRTSFACATRRIPFTRAAVRMS